MAERTGDFEYLERLECLECFECLDCQGKP